ncbi:hypothetical protein HYW54_02660 [Candidatus Gottesmanbacteria bacterium]|nr:hypothetical protein [Candidatus Gottesmanbacteria bacterium]
MKNIFFFLLFIIYLVLFPRDVSADTWGTRASCYDAPVPPFTNYYLCHADNVGGVNYKVIKVDSSPPGFIYPVNDIKLHVETDQPNTEFKVRQFTLDLPEPAIRYTFTTDKDGLFEGVMDGPWGVSDREYTDQIIMWRQSGIGGRDDTATKINFFITFLPNIPASPPLPASCEFMLINENRVPLFTRTSNIWIVEGKFLGNRTDLLEGQELVTYLYGAKGLIREGRARIYKKDNQLWFEQDLGKKFIPDLNTYQIIVIDPDRSKIGCFRKFDITETGEQPKLTDTPIPTKPDSSECKNLVCNEKKCNDQSDPCNQCPQLCSIIHTSTAPQIPLKPLCEQVGRSSKIGEPPTDCEKCVVPYPTAPYLSDDIKYKGIWTAVGCVPTDVPNILKKFVWPFGLGMAGGVAFLYFLYGAFLILTSMGNPERINNGKEIMISSISGLLLIIFSIFILQVIGVQILRIPGFG